MLMSMYLRLADSCIQCSASCAVPAAPTMSVSDNAVAAFSASFISDGNIGSCIPMFAVNLYFHSSNVA